MESQEGGGESPPLYFPGNLPPGKHSIRPDTRLSGPSTPQEARNCYTEPHLTRKNFYSGGRGHKYPRVPPRKSSGPTPRHGAEVCLSFGQAGEMVYLWT